MLSLLKQHIIDHIGPQDNEEIDGVLANFKEVNTDRNQMLLQNGEVCRHVYYVAKGCVQVYNIDDEGNENTRDIVTENYWVADLQSFGSGEPSVWCIRTVEPSLLFSIDKPGFGLMMETVPNFEKVYRKILEYLFAESVYRINTFISMSALDRVKWLMEHKPKLMARLSNKLIASYLGISQETLSRIKAKL